MMANQLPAMFAKINQAIMQDTQNADFSAQGIKPLYAASSTAKLLIIGQAPGKRAQDSHICWNDPSGDRLRDWLGISRTEFYDPSRVAILPMDFYFPGKGRSGDLPPRKGFADKWHPQMLALMPQVELIVLVGAYATKRYLKLPSKVRLTDVVRDYPQYLPRYFPLVHPSPRNQIWFKRNPWFDQEVVPALKQCVRQLLG